MTDINNLVIQMIEFEGEDVESNNAQFPTSYIDIFEDTGAQGHASLTSLNYKYKNVNVIVKMVNREKATIYQKVSCTIFLFYAVCFFNRYSSKSKQINESNNEK